MPNPNPIRQRRPFSLRHLRETAFGSNPTNATIHSVNMPMDYYYDVDDFRGTLDATRWTATNTGTSSVTPIFSAARGGVLTTAAGTTNPSCGVFYGTNAIFASDDNPMFGVRLKIPSVITNIWYEIGWANVITTKTTQSVSALSAAAVPTVGNGLTDGGGFVINTGYTLATAAAYGIGTSTAAAGVAIGTYTPTASKWVDIFVGVGVGVSSVTVWDNSGLVGQYAVASGPDTGVLLFPYFQAGSLGVLKTTLYDKVIIVAENNQT